MQLNYLKVSIQNRCTTSYTIVKPIIPVIDDLKSFSNFNFADVASSSTISSALISRQTQATQIQTAMEHSTTIDLYDLSTDHDDTIYRDTITSPDTSFLPPTVAARMSHNNSLPPKHSNNTNRFRNTTQNFHDYLSGDRRWPCGLTNFHFSLCFGMVGFTVFWTGLLLRIYLPHEYFS